MNELRRTLEDAFAIATDKATRDLVGQALDMLDTKEAELMAKVRRMRQRMWSWGASTKVMYILSEEFPDVQ